LSALIIFPPHLLCLFGAGLAHRSRAFDGMICH